MGLFYCLNYRKKATEYDKGDVVSVNIKYNYKGQQLKVATGISVKIKDWNHDWRKTHTKHPIKSTDSSFESKNRILKDKYKEIEDIIDNLIRDKKVPLTTLVKTYIRNSTHTI